MCVDFDNGRMPSRPLDHWVMQRARELRQQMTPEERELWAALRNRRWRGLKFRRQVPLGRYVADFACLEARLVVELDGHQHGEDRARDDVRDAWLVSQGFTVLRVWNSEWREAPEWVLGRIEEELTSPPAPLRQAERGGRGGGHGSD